MQDDLGKAKDIIMDGLRAKSGQPLLLNALYSELVVKGGFSQETIGEAVRELEEQGRIRTSYPKGNDLLWQVVMHER